MSELALFGGKPAVTYVGTGKNDGTDMFKWPVITKEDEEAALSVLRVGGMSGTNVTKEFEADFCKWVGAKYALGTCNGTAALHAAMFGCGVGRGDEVICPSRTYWASCTSALTLGATVVFGDIDPNTLCLDPKKLEAKITSKTKAIIVVHYLGYPADMDEIMAIAKKHNVKVIEDVSHAQGGLYKGRKLGTIGDVAAMSLMAGKSLAIGEAGILHTDDIEIYERAIAFGTYERFSKDFQTEYLRPLAGLPLGGYKHRMHQISAAVGRVQLKYYDERCATIRKAMNYFWDLLEGVPGIRAHRVDESTGSNMAGWYAAHGLYVPEELEGLSVTRFCEALRAEGVDAVSAGCNLPLHTHPLFQVADVYNDGKPTRIAFTDKDVREMDNDLDVCEDIGARTYSIPWFKNYEPEVIEQYANAFKKVCANYKELLADDPGNPAQLGGWHFFQHTAKKKA
ncbi:MAG: DegT/DnrJ/EryC1/StrS family aminotransferase [Oscillospiraceae bacterium]|nr:DegT/DnrJ/EryC1/StrS family aminotransferase [Oscillospiraceae bacterium]